MKNFSTVIRHFTGVNNITIPINRSNRTEYLFSFPLCDLIHSVACVGYENSICSVMGHGTYLMLIPAQRLLRLTTQRQADKRRKPNCCPGLCDTKPSYRHNTYNVALNTLRPRQNGHHFANNLFNCFFNENV